MDVAKALDAIPIVVSATERAILFAVPAIDQRVYNKATFSIERWNGITWLTDLVASPYSTPETGAVDLRYPVGNALRYGAKGDCRTVLDGAITTGTPTLTSATAGFTLADQGKSIMIAHAGPPVAASGTVSAAAGVATFSTSQAGVLANGSVIVVAGIAYTVSGFNGTTTATLSGAPTFGATTFGTATVLSTTIAAYVNATTVTLTANASATVTAKRMVYWLTNDFTTLQAWLTAVGARGGGIATLPQATYAVDTTTGSLLIPDNVIVDLGRSTIQRVGTNTTNRLFQNATYGITQNKNIAVLNGVICGTASFYGNSDQGGAIGLYLVSGWRLENIETQDTNGDGVQWREAPNGTFHNIKIGDYGRNGVSPTSSTGGRVDWDNVEISGVALPLASPGHDIDAENNSAAETGDYSFRNVKARNLCTFVDFFTAAAGTFAFKVKITACEFGPSFKSLRFQSTNATVTDGVEIDSATIIRGGGGQSATNALWVENVSGVKCHAKFASDGTGTTRNAITAVGTVSSLYLEGVKQTGAWSKGLISFAATDLLTCFAMDCVLADVFLTGSNSRFDNCSIAALTLSRAASINNIFGATCTATSTTFSNGALVGSNFFGFAVTWSPSLVGDGAAGTYTPATNTGSVAYRNGEVTGQAEIAWSAHTGTGNMKIINLPYAAAGAGKGRTVVLVRPAGGFIWTAGNQLYATIDDGATEIVFKQCVPATGVEGLVPIRVAATVRVEFRYFA